MRMIGFESVNKNGIVSIFMKDSLSITCLQIDHV